MDEKLIRLDNYIDVHLHTAPDIKPRLYFDIEAALHARAEKMAGLVIKSHLESTASRARIAQEYTQIPVWGGVCLNSHVGGINAPVVEASAQLGAKIVWLPTISAPQIKVTPANLEEILPIIRDHDMVLATGHLEVADIFLTLDLASSWGVKRLLVNHPLTSVVGADLDEQKEMSRYAYLEHCFVACMREHDNLKPSVIAQAIQEIGASRCIMATDFGQKHNPPPVKGFKLFIKAMLEEGISPSKIHTMCYHNTHKLLLK